VIPSFNRLSFAYFGLKIKEKLRPYRYYHRSIESIERFSG